MDINAIYKRLVNIFLIALDYFYIFESSNEINQHPIEKSLFHSNSCRTYISAVFFAQVTVVIISKFCRFRSTGLRWRIQRISIRFYRR
jgi:hypothetical protein